MRSPLSRCSSGAMISFTLTSIVPLMALAVPASPPGDGIPVSVDSERDLIQLRRCGTSEGQDSFRAFVERRAVGVMRSRLVRTSPAFSKITIGLTRQSSMLPAAFEIARPRILGASHRCTHCFAAPPTPQSLSASPPRHGVVTAPALIHMALAVSQVAAHSAKSAMRGSWPAETDPGCAGRALPR
jgi:hypothetical protein